MIKVLIVDDEEMICSLLEQALAMKGYHCTVAVDAVAARQCLRQARFELIISDYSMPGETGLELLQHVLDQYPDTATMMVTGSNDVVVRKRALDIGVGGYMLKPFKLNDLLASVEKALDTATRTGCREIKACPEDLAKSSSDRLVARGKLLLGHRGQRRDLKSLGYFRFCPGEGRA